MTKFFQNKKNLTYLIAICVILIVLLVCSLAVRAGDTHECHDCDGEGVVDMEVCESCAGTGEIENESRYSETFVALLAPIIAIALALITKEVYSSLFIGILIGGFLYGNYNFASSIDAIVNDGIISAISDNAGIFAFLVMLGILVVLVNKAGGSQAFGRWAEKNVKTKMGAILATFALGVLIFIDDYFNCLTVGSVMKPVTDGHKISRAKLAYIIDATAAPVCMIAPVSSWAAAVSQYASDGNGFKLFVTAIPFNFYSLLTLVFVVTIAILGFDYGKMAGFEIKANNGELGAEENVEEISSEKVSERGRVFDLLIPIGALIISCIIGLIYVGGFFDKESANYHSFIGAFGDTDAFVGLPWGALIALVAIIIYLIARKLITFKDAMEAVPKGFVAMVPAMFILTFATALKNITSLLGAKYFVKDLLSNAGALSMFLPAIIFIVACVLSFSTGTSWGTFGILIPIVTVIFPIDNILGVISMSACLAGAVCGDHCSPISDTSIMASAGAQCNHVDHISTQLPYAITVAGVSFVSFIIAGIFGYVNKVLAYVSIPIALALMVGTIFVIKYITKKKQNEQANA